MFDKLTTVERQYEAIMERLGSPELQGDPSEYRKQSKSLSEIEPLVERFREYKTLVRDITQTEELAAAGDGDMRELAQEEAKSLVAKRDALLADLSISLRCVVSQRLVRAKSGGRIPAVEVMLNTSHIAELIKKGSMHEIKDAMEQSLAPGSQTFEQALYNLYREGQITLEHALANSDSPTNLHWLINNAGPTADSGISKSPEQDTSSRTTTGPAADLSSIKLNLDMV